MPATLGIFAKHPDHGPVKTRLGAEIGTHAAIEVARLMLQFLLGQLRHSLGRNEIVGWPPDAIYDFRSLSRPHWTVTPQTSGDLGEKMNHWFETAVAPSPGTTIPQTAIAIGSDCPMVTPGHLHEAAEMLNGGCDLVLGPAGDGGYWLIGVRQPHPLLFDNVIWSSSEVRAQTLHNAARIGWKTRLLDPLDDVDDLAGLHRAIEQLRSSASPDFRELAESLEYHASTPGTEPHR